MGCEELADSDVHKDLSYAYAWFIYTNISYNAIPMKKLNRHLSKQG